MTSTTGQRLRLGIVATHPIQYQCPLWRKLGASSEIESTVLFLSRHGLEEGFDPFFGTAFAWDVPLIDGYPHEFLPSFRVPGTGNNMRWGPTSTLLTTGLTSRVRRGDFDAILVQGYSSGAAWAGTLAGWRTGTPVIVRGESHDRGRPHSWRQSARRLVLSAWMKQVDVALAIGSLNREMWRGLGLSDDRIFVSPYAIDNDRFQQVIAAAPARAAELRQSWGAGPDDVVFLFSGKLTPVKAPELLLSAFASLRPNSSAHLVFVGAGPLEGQLRAVQAQLGLSRVHWAGFVNQRDIPHFYHAADVLVLPSRVEPWGLVVNEALSCGTPCIVSDMVGSGPDLIEGFGAGLVFPSGDVSALQRSLEKAMDAGRRKSWRSRLDEFRDRVNLDRNVEAITEAVRIVARDRRR